MNNKTLSQPALPERQSEIVRYIVDQYIAHNGMWHATLRDVANAIYKHHNASVVRVQTEQLIEAGLLANCYHDSTTRAAGLYPTPEALRLFGDKELIFVDASQ